MRSANSDWFDPLSQAASSRILQSFLQSSAVSVMVHDQGVSCQSPIFSKSNPASYLASSRVYASLLMVIMLSLSRSKSFIQLFSTLTPTRSIVCKEHCQGGRYITAALGAQFPRIFPTNIPRSPISLQMATSSTAAGRAPLMGRNGASTA